MLRETTMKNQTPKPHKLKRVVRVLLLPVVAVLWLIGWSLYWIGSRKQLGRSAKSNRHEDVTFTVLMPEQKHAA
jgi:hypothetical protein